VTFDTYLIGGSGMQESEKVEISLRPIKKIVILNCTKFRIEEFFKRIEMMAISGEQVALNWAEGIVFLALPYQAHNDIIVEQALKGTRYWTGVIFSQMPKYQSIKKIGAREIPIIDQTADPQLRQVAQWLRKRLEPE